LRSRKSKVKAQLPPEVANGTLPTARSEEFDLVDQWHHQLRGAIGDADYPAIRRAARKIVSAVKVWTRLNYRGNVVWYQLDRAVIQFTEAFANTVVRCPGEMQLPASARTFSEKSHKGRPMPRGVNKPAKRARKDK
jgi:hypothetical protein